MLTVARYLASNDDQQFVRRGIVLYMHFPLSVLSAVAFVVSYMIIQAQLLSQKSRRSLHGHSTQGQHCCWSCLSCGFMHLHDILQCSGTHKVFHKVSVENFLFTLQYMPGTLASTEEVIVLYSMWNYVQLGKALGLLFLKY